MTITEFLEARIAKDEALAREAERWADDGDEPHIRWVGQGRDSLVHRLGKAGPHIAAMSPTRVLAECAAKRAVLKSYDSCMKAEKATVDFGPRLVTSGMVKGLELAVKHLASAYATHPDYRQEWEV